jgi:hypothetical protein
MGDDTRRRLQRIVYPRLPKDALDACALRGFDKLEEAGCTDAALLDHCRRPGEHWPGCWAAELLAEGEAKKKGRPRKGSS